MSVIYMVFGGLVVVCGVIEMALISKLGGAIGIVFGAIVFSLSSVVERIATLERKLAELASAIPPAPEEVAAPAAASTAKPDEDLAAAKALLATAEAHHFGKRFAEAREIYTQIAEQYPATKQAATARQQLDNLRGLS